MEMSQPSRRRSAWPTGLFGMLALIAGVEWYVGRHGDRFSTLDSAAWRYGGEMIGSASRCQVVALGDSLVKHGIVSPVVAERTGRTATNLALSGSSTVAHDFLLRRMLRAGARPDVLIIDGENNTANPYDLARVWGELLTCSEAAELAYAGRDPAFFARMALALAMPTYRQRNEVRFSIVQALDGKVSPQVLALPVLRRNWRRNGGAQVLPDPHHPPGKDPERDKAINGPYEPIDWSCHPINDLYVHKLLDRAAARGIPVIWLLPPFHPEVEERRVRYGAGPKARAYLRALVARYPNLTVVDGQHAGYSRNEMFDSTHLSRAGALAYSETVGRLIRNRLDHPELWSANRWLALPRYDASAVETLASAASVEDQTQSGRNLARVMEDEHRKRQERRLAGAVTPGRRQ